MQLVTYLESSGKAGDRVKATATCDKSKHAQKESLEELFPPALLQD